MDGTGLILEGGGMRGAFTAGVLDYFLEEEMHFPYVIGASAGACNGSSYIAKQKGRNYKVIVGYGNHPQYISYKRFFTNKELFGMDFIFDTLPNKLVPFNYEGFFQDTKNNQKFVVGTTDIHTGQPRYFDTFDDKESLLRVIRASSSLPFISPVIQHEGTSLMDGGIADPIPIEPSIEAGNKKHVVVLTRNAGYKKQKMKFTWFVKKNLKGFPNLHKALESRHEKYNETMEKLEEMERTGEVYIIRPTEALSVSRIERNQKKLHVLYEQGYQEAKQQHKELMEFLYQKEDSLVKV